MGRIQLKPGLSGFLRLLVIAVLIALLLVLVPSGAIHSYAELLTLPMDESGGVVPHEWAYTGNTAYEDPSLSVRIEQGRFLDTDWTSVSIKAANPTQVRTLKAGPYGSTREAKGSVLAARVNAVLAIGGDFFTYHNYGYIVRQGQFYRNKPTGKQDVLVIDDKGDLHVLLKADRAMIEAFEKEHRDSIVNAFTFGPALMDKGQPVTLSADTKSDVVKAQRIALCQTDELEYMVVYCEGPNDVNSKGLSILQFQELVASFPGVITAYNLDGGSSATIVFQGEKINGPRSQRSRSIGDIIYFASVYKPD